MICVACGEHLATECGSMICAECRGATYDVAGHKQLNLILIDYDSWMRITMGKIGVRLSRDLYLMQLYLHYSLVDKLLHPKKYRNVVRALRQSGCNMGDTSCQKMSSTSLRLFLMYAGIDAEFSCDNSRITTCEVVGISRSGHAVAFYRRLP